MLEASIGAIEAQALVPDRFDALLAAPIITPAGTLDATFYGDRKLYYDADSSGGSIAYLIATVLGRLACWPRTLR